MQNKDPDPCAPRHNASLEERLASEIACLKSALTRLEKLREEPGYRWICEFYDKTIARREAVLRELTAWRNPS